MIIYRTFLSYSTLTHCTKLNSIALFIHFEPFYPFYLICLHSNLVQQGAGTAHINLGSAPQKTSLPPLLT